MGRPWRKKVPEESDTSADTKTTKENVRSMLFAPGIRVGGAAANVPLGIDAHLRDSRFQLPLPEKPGGFKCNHFFANRVTPPPNPRHLAQALGVLVVRQWKWNLLRYSAMAPESSSQT